MQASALRMRCRRSSAALGLFDAFRLATERPAMGDPARCLADVSSLSALLAMSMLRARWCQQPRRGIGRNSAAGAIGGASDRPPVRVAQGEARWMSADAAHSNPSTSQHAPSSAAGAIRYARKKDTEKWPKWPEITQHFVSFSQAHAKSGIMRRNAGLSACLGECQLPRSTDAMKPYVALGLGRKAYGPMRFAALSPRQAKATPVPHPCGQSVWRRAVAERGSCRRLSVSAPPERPQRRRWPRTNLHWFEAFPPASWTDGP